MSPRTSRQNACIAGVLWMFWILSAPTLGRCEPWCSKTTSWSVTLPTSPSSGGGQSLICNYCSYRVSENIHIACSSPNTAPSLWAAVAIVRPAQRVLASPTLPARYSQAPVLQLPFQILLPIRPLMPKLPLPLTLSGIPAQFPDIHSPSVRPSHAQSQEAAHPLLPCPTTLMPEAHRAPWSSRLNKASGHLPLFRSCDLSFSFSFPTLSPPPSPGFFADRT